MKSDREFLTCVYAKAEKLMSVPTPDYDLDIKEYFNNQTQKKHALSSQYVRYAGMAAGFLLLISSALLINHLGRSNQISNKPIPSNFRMMGYTNQIIEQATDIIAVKANHEENDITLSIIKYYKDSGYDSQALNSLDNDVIGLSPGQSAIVFIDATSKDASVVDIFVWEADSNSYINAKGEMITEETLNNIK